MADYETLPPASNGWHRVDLEESTAANDRDDMGRGFALYWGEFDTPSGYFQKLIMHPLVALSDEGRDLLDAGRREMDMEPYEGDWPGDHGIGEGWTVRTVVFNHHRGLNPRIGFTSLLVDEQTEEVEMGIHKHEPVA
ncbi:MAG: hypothetical protein WB239_01575 [Acidimicrobiia bacterium]